MSDVHKTPFLMTGEELKKLKVQPSEWIVDGLLRVGRKRVSLLAGKPEDGKSTLAKQLAVAVMQGKEFLGRKTQRGAVLYWQTEDEAADVRHAFDNLGYDHTRDAELFVFTGSPTENTVANLRDVLVNHPEIKLVIVETLDDLLKLSDVKENTAARIGFDKFDTVVVKEFCQSVVFLCLHHLKKKEESTTGDMLLGATVLRGRTDAKWYIRRVSDDDERRVFFATVRTGNPLPKTYLDFDATTGISVLGLTLKEDEQEQANMTEQRILSDIIKYFTLHPDASFRYDCLPVVFGNADQKRRIFKKAVSDGMLLKKGKGVKGDPDTYRVSEGYAESLKLVGLVGAA